MNKYVAIFVNDMKNTRRDPTLLVMLIIPVMFIIITRFGFPPLVEQWPITAEYIPLTIAFFCVITAMMPGYIVSFMLLDERDQNVITAIRTMPVTPEGFFGMRMLFMFVFGLVGSFLLLQLNGVIAINMIKSLIISVVCAVCSPFFVFITISLAKNKIEGATIMKVLNVLIMLPLVSYFVDSPFTYIFSIIPFFWVYEGFKHLNNTGQFIMFFGIGLMIAMLINYFFYKYALKRFYYR